MTLVRSCGVPVPLIYAYSCQSGNPVRTEYLIMEKAKGAPLADVWLELSEKQQKKIT